MNVKIVTDSTADMPTDLANKLGITVVPAYVYFGNDVYRDRVDISDYDIDRNNVLYAVMVEPDYSYTEVVEPTHPIGKWYPALIKAFNGARVQITSATEDMTKLTLFVSSDRDPGSFYLFDTTKGGVEQLAKVKPWINPKQIGSSFPVAIQARDGYTNYAYVSTPVGKEKNLPLVIIPHGGPHGPRDY